MVSTSVAVKRGGGGALGWPDKHRALAAVAAFPAVPSETDTLPENVSVPDTPFGGGRDIGDVGRTPTSE